jgi:hypothetical protein
LVAGFRIGFISRLTPSPSLAPLPSYPFLPPLLLLLLLLIDSSRKVMSNGTLDPLSYIQFCASLLVSLLDYSV